MENVQERGAITSQLTSLVRQAAAVQAAPLYCPRPRRGQGGARRVGAGGPPELNELSVILNRGILLGSPPSCVPGYGCSPPTRCTNPVIMDAKFRQRQCGVASSPTLSRTGMSGLSQAMHTMSVDSSHINRETREAPNRVFGFNLAT